MKKQLILIALGLSAAILASGCKKIEETEKAPQTEAKQTETSAPAQDKTDEAVTENVQEALSEESVTEGTGTEADGSESVAEDETSAPKEAAPAASAKGSGEVVVYNWGEYIDPEVLDMFTEETGIKVIYEEFETNEIMYPKVAAGAISYDVICPSDYMIDKMIKNDLLAPINFDNVPNVKNIGSSYMSWSKEFDPENLYSVPYCWGTVGILYNKTMVDETVDSWEILWDEKYKDNILMQDSVRDALMIPLKMNGCSMNTDKEEEIAAAAQKLIDQKPLVQAYVVDQVRDKMIGNEAALGVIFSGEAIYTQRENPDLEYVIPKEGSNVWIDSWVIPKNARNKENAEAFINFMCRADIALMNFDYITYSTPNEAARELIEDEDIRNSTIAFPTDEMLEGCQTYTSLEPDVENIYNDYWNKVKSS